MPQSFFRKKSRIVDPVQAAAEKAAAAELKYITTRGRESFVKNARNIKPTTASELWAYVRAFFGFTMPHTACCLDHQTPFHMLWYLFSRQHMEFAALGSRSSYKTLTLAISETLDLIFGQGNIIHIGAIDKQAQRCYTYVKKFLFPTFSDLVTDSLMVRTTMNSGNRLEIIPCTVNQVNGPHESRVNFDEVELSDPKAYDEAKGIPVSNHITGEPPAICYTSTRKYAGGLFEKELDKLHSMNKPVITFCYKDVSQPCPDSRSGRAPVQIYVNKDTFAWSQRKETDEMDPYMVLEGCLKCPLVPSCTADLKRAHGITPIIDAITRFSTATPDFWIAQGECRKPMRRGMMIYNFNKKTCVHKIDWSIFMDKRGYFNRERFIFVGGKDFNWSIDATLMAVIDLQLHHIYFIKEFNFHQIPMTTISQRIVQWCSRTPFSLPSDIQCDKSAPGSISIMQGNGLGMAKAVEDSDVEGGVTLLNYLCNPMSQAPMIHIDPEGCPTFIWEMAEGYKRKMNQKTGEPGETPDKRNDHFCDCARYIVWCYLKQYADPYGEFTNDKVQKLAGMASAYGGDRPLDVDEMAKLLILSQQQR